MNRKELTITKGDPKPSPMLASENPAAVWTDIIGNRLKAFVEKAKYSTPYINRIFSF